MSVVVLAMLSLKLLGNEINVSIIQRTRHYLALFAGYIHIADHKVIKLSYLWDQTDQIADYEKRNTNAKKYNDKRNTTRQNCGSSGGNI